MGKAKHTPGPWYRDDDGFIAAGDGDGYKTVASPNCSDMDIDERESNAQLIVAAPDMLDALLTAEAELENHVAVPGVKEHVLPCVRAAITLAMSKDLAA